MGCGKMFWWAECERHICGENFILPSGKKKRNYYLCRECKTKKAEKTRVTKTINKMIKKPYVMVGGNPKSNHIFREGRIEGLKELKKVFSSTVHNANLNQDGGEK